MQWTPALLHELHEVRTIRLTRDDSNESPLGRPVSKDVSSLSARHHSDPWFRLSAMCVNLDTGSVISSAGIGCEGHASAMLGDYNVGSACGQGDCQTAGC